MNNKKNLLFFPLATIGRDMCGQLFSMSVLNYILFTKNLTVSQFSVVSLIIVLARLFDAFNDPFMGTLIDHTKTKIGKFKPWIIAGVTTTSVVVYFAFVNSFKGWAFVKFFAFIYFLFSICFTMNDVSYWGMIPSLSTDPEMRNKFTSRTVFFSGMGAGFVSVLAPILTAGDHVIGGNAVTAYRVLAIIACLASPVTMILLCFVKENRSESSITKEKVSVRKIFRTIFRNDQLKWIAIVFVIAQLGTALLTNGLGATYIYFEFGYNGTLATFFTVVGMSSTVVMMLIYPTVAKRKKRRELVSLSLKLMMIGYSLMLLFGLLIPKGNIIKFVLIVCSLAVANLGAYTVYLICMICLSNSIEYNEYKFGVREDGVITSARPFLTKLSNAIVLLETSLLYMAVGVTKYTNRISDLENQASQGLINSAEKLDMISQVLENVQNHQTVMLLIFMSVIPMIMGVLSCVIFKKKYTLDEEKYILILNELEKRY